MMGFSFFLVCALLALLVALTAVVRRSRSVASWCFAAGMFLLAAECLLTGAGVRALREGVGSEADLERGGIWLSWAMVARSLLAGVWLSFGLSYSRGDSRECLYRWRYVLAATLIVPLALVIGFRSELVRPAIDPEASSRGWIVYGTAAKALHLMLLGAIVLILMQVEKTFRSVVGTLRWRVKFLVLGLAVLFGAKIYTLSQALLYSAYNPSMASIDAGALSVACVLMAIGYFRSGFAELDIYPSRAVLQSSVTVAIVGGYLILVGVLSQLVGVFGDGHAFPAQAFMVLLGMAALAVLLLSDRFRLLRQRFVSRHFKRPQHDFRVIWTRFSQRLSRVVDRQAYCEESSKLISEVFDVLSVSIFLSDGQRDALVLAGSTSVDGEIADGEVAVDAMLRSHRVPFDLDREEGDWAEPLREATPIQFLHGGNRICVPLRSGEQLLGVAVLADRVEGAAYTQEELELLQCIGEEVSAGLLNLTLTDELVQSRELEAFQTMSAFFVHDMKNAASSLNLTLQNLPRHMDDPEFREDALRGIAKTAEKINRLTARLGALRKKFDIQLAEADLNEIVMEALDEFGSGGGFDIVKELRPLPKIRVDREQIGSVFTNLLHNARDASDSESEIAVETKRMGDNVVLSVEDKGCGMTGEFVKESLFKPFRSTKKQGLGVGMFQSRMIIEAHRGNILVDSDPGRGTIFRISLPLS